MTALVVHGGAGVHAAEGRDAKMKAVGRALDAGWAVLDQGGGSMDAVEAAVRILESDPLFDAGFGSYLNRDGLVEVDAILMDGASLRFGAVAAVPQVLHPVSLARLVMTASPHAMLAGAGALRFAEIHGLRVPAEEVIAPRPLEIWRADRSARASVAPRTAAASETAAGTFGDTVGAVALDAAGHVAAATSTGGTRDKLPGRVGDSPVVGSGAYADDATGAISSTGHGESILRVCMAFQANQQLASGASAGEAASAALDVMERRTGGKAGLIVVSRTGHVAWAFNTQAMPLAWRTLSGEGAVFTA